MRHEEAALLLTDFVRGRLGEGPSRDLESHIDGCPDCRDLIETLRVLSAARSGDAETAAEHPSSQDLATYVAFPGRLGIERESRIREHLGDCPACKEGVEITLEACASSEARGFLSRFRLPRFLGMAKRRSLAIGLAAAAGLLLFGVLLFLGLYRLPLISGELGSLRARNADLESRLHDMEASLGRASKEPRMDRSWTGPVSLIVLTGTQRRVGNEPVASVTQDQPYIPLAVLPSLPKEAGPEEFYRFEIRHRGGEIVWSSRLSAGRIRQELSASQVVTFLVPTPLLPPDRYELTFSRESPPSSEPLLAIPFQVRQGE